MKTAIIVTGGKQYRVAEGDVIYVEKMNVEAGETVTFEQVLAVIDEENSVFGAPVVAGATVSASVVKNGKAKKVRVYKMKPKKGYHRTQGHRQPYTKIQICCRSCATVVSMKLSICHSPLQPQTSYRKLRSMSLPCSVWLTSGWN